MIRYRQFTCFRLVPSGNELIPVALRYTRARMAAFVEQRGAL
jgi:hypothetical protein